MQKLLSIVLVLTILLTAMTGCSKKNETSESNGKDNTKKDTSVETNTDTEEKITLTFWHTYGDGEEKQLKEVVLPMWQEKYPNITIEAVRQDSGQFHQMMVTAFGTGQTPDVARIDIVNTAAYADVGGIAALDNFEGFGEIKDSFLEGPLSTNLYKEHYYGLPLDTNTKAAVVNLNTMKTIGFTEAPATMEEFIAAAEKSEVPLLNVSGVGDWDLYPYFWLFGGTLTDEGFTKASGYLDSQASVDAINKLIELHNNKVFTIRDVDGSVDAWDGIRTGEYAMFFEGPWFFGSYEENLEQGIVPAVIPSYNGRSASVVGGENIAIFEASENKEAAFEFLKFMTSEEVQLVMLEVGQIPVLKNLVTNSQVTENPIWSVYMKQLESAGARIPSPNHTGIGEAWSNAMMNIFANKADVLTELQNAAALMDSHLAQ